MSMEEPRFFNKGAWKGVVIAVIAVAASQFVLPWQYYRLEEKRLPVIEQQLAEQRQEMERQAAKEAVVLFLDAWKEGDAVLAQRYLTENAVLQEQGGMFSLQQGFSDYAIVKIEKLEKGGFRAQVEKQTEQGLPKQVEVLLVRKILDAYYVDSVEIAG